MDIKDARRDIGQLAGELKRFKALGRLPEVVEFLSGELEGYTAKKDQIATLDKEVGKLADTLAKTETGVKDKIKRLEAKLKEAEAAFDEGYKIDKEASDSRVAILQQIEMNLNASIKDKREELAQVRDDVDAEAIKLEKATKDRKALAAELSA